jgi:hypothetical protein
MKAYVITTGVLFGLLVVAHVMRAFEEGAHVLTNRCGYSSHFSRRGCALVLAGAARGIARRTRTP